MVLPARLEFSSAPSTVMHLDLNSCFATIEQQANPLLRHRPIVVAAYTTPNGCILAPSVQAKKLGIKVGMRVGEGRLLCPHLVVLDSDPHKYRAVHLGLQKILSDYTPKLVPKSIDEFVLDLAGTPAFDRGLILISQEIKDRIKKELGDYLTVSIGLGPNRFLAKTASNLHKPDGLDEINQSNFLAVYESLTLTDITGIARQNALRLNSLGIYTVSDFFRADLPTLHSAFGRVYAYRWFARLRGFEVDDLEWGTKSFGHSYALPKFLTQPEELAPILSKLVEKLGYRMRQAGYQARGVRLSLIFADYQDWHQGLRSTQPLFLSQDIYRLAYRLLSASPRHSPVRNLAVSCFDLSSRDSLQLGLFENCSQKESLVKAIDDIKGRWGDFAITPATMTTANEAVPDRISFGR